MTNERVLKYGPGYHLVTVEEAARLVLGIRCLACQRVSFCPTDISERYCGHCHVFHEDGLLRHEA
jgi:hypothetical protein